ncbi:TolC family protein [Catenovulum maritimum]|uniref:RND transporter n=1 Tax=Catenovulum maritimum TaxID=1513271 RepID=A0A0J8GY46_9ALTE|nr:TolC family protein [Catenovulum maritimum]KMT65653.1 hypothetical protein XM47_08125 [Catenovulum maritimum]
MFNMKKSLVLSAFSIWLVGCSSTADNFEPNQLTSSTVYINSLTSESAQHAWWKSHKSQQLNNLVQQAISSNYNLRAAQKRYSASMSMLGYEENQHWPQGGLSAETTRQSVNGQISSESSLGVSANWQIDLFGRLSALVKAAQADSLKAKEQSVLLLSEVITGTNNSFFQWQGNQLKLRILEQQIAVLEESIEVLTARVDEGFASNLDLNRAYAQLNQQKALIPQIKSELFRHKVTLATLTGVTTEKLNLIFEPELVNQELDLTISVVKPEEAIAQHPKIIMAQYDFLKQSALSDASQAALYPSISITGFAGLLNPVGSDLSSNHDAWSVTPKLTWSLLSLPALKAQAKAQALLSEAQLIEYENTLIEVISHSQLSLSQIKNAKQISQFSTKRLFHAEQAQSQALAMYEEGKVPYLDLLTARQEALLAKQAEVDSKVQFILAKISAYQAFNGGWSRAIL